MELDGSIKKKQKKSIKRKVKREKKRESKGIVENIDGICKLYIGSYRGEGGKGGCVCFRFFKGISY